MSEEATREEMLNWIDRTLHGWNHSELSHTTALANPTLIKAIKEDIGYLKTIRRLIESQITDEQLFEIRAQEYERGLKDGKPEVDEEFIERWTKKMIDIDNVRPPENEFIRWLLESAGVQIKED